MIGRGAGRGRRTTTVKAFVDFQNDVTAKDIRLAVREGMHSIEHVKRFTTNGMATDQGKTSNIHGLAIAAEALGKADAAGRADDVPRALYAGDVRRASSAMRAGELFDPTRRTPMHGWEEAQGAVFEDVGQWKRAWYYPRAGEDMHAAVNRECRTVREVGRHVRRLDARQDRGGRARMRRSSSTCSTPIRWQKLAAGPLQIRHHAARGRLHL